MAMTNNGQGNVRNYNIKSRVSGADFGNFTGADRSDVIAEFYECTEGMFDIIDVPDASDLIVTDLDTCEATL
jgi:hypothetical protein